MGKRELNNYLTKLSKKQLEEQIKELYSKFNNVKEYYDFSFNPKEDSIITDCRFRINKEYFPPPGRKAKKRRSVAQKFIRKFKLLEVEPYLIADIMLFNIETAQKYSKENKVYDSFYISMLKSFTECIDFVQEYSLYEGYRDRIETIAKEAWDQDWINKLAFENLLI